MSAELTTSIIFGSITTAVAIIACIIAARRQPSLAEELQKALAPLATRAELQQHSKDNAEAIAAVDQRIDDTQESIRTLVPTLQTRLESADNRKAIDDSLRRIHARIDETKTEMTDNFKELGTRIAQVNGDHERAIGRIEGKLDQALQQKSIPPKPH